MKKALVLHAAPILAVGVLAYLFSAPIMSQAGEPTTPDEAKALVKMVEKFSLPLMGADTETTLKIGDALPPLKCADLEGKPLEINDMYGEKGTLVVFWATWCGACMHDLPHEASLARFYKAKGLNVIGVNADDDPARARAVIDAFSIKWPTIYEPKEDQSADGIVKRLEIKTWPTLLLFDSNRKLVSASPDLRMLRKVKDSAENSYWMKSLDCTIIKLIGPLQGAPHISQVP